MVPNNADIQTIFEQVADLLEIKGDNIFKIRAYRNAARLIGGLPQAMSTLLEQGEDLSTLSGIGKTMAEKIGEIVSTGHLSLLSKLKEELPAGLLELLKVPALGPKRVKILHRQLGIENVSTLEKAAREGKISQLSGFGRKTELNILESLTRIESSPPRLKWIQAERIARTMCDYLRQVGKLQAIEVAGSFRRKKETVGDLDILVVCPSPRPIMEHFIHFTEIETILSHGSTRSSVLLHSGVQVDLRVVSEDSYGAALHYFTGSQAHNIAIRQLAQKRGLKINEYGVFRDEQWVAGRREEDIFSCLDLPYIEPELREHRGELEAARESLLPELITLNHIKGDLHSHSDYSDGLCSIREMAEAARQLGYHYLAITDHSQRLAIANGLSVERLEKQIEEIDRLNETSADFVILKGIEVDILADGSLDLPNQILEKLDLVIAAVHSRFKMPLDEQTTRIITAMSNPAVHILAHPTGRLINGRNPYDLDMDRVLAAAHDTGCVLELNSNPDRLDLTDISCKAARNLGVRVAINTDAHSVTELGNISYGINQARRGWLTPPDVINCLTLTELLDVVD